MSSKKTTPVQQALRTLRKRLGLTQRKLALILDVTVVTVCRWETTRPPSGASLAQLAAFARSSAEHGIAKTFSQSFLKEFHLKEDPFWVGPKIPYRWINVGLAINELVEYKEHPAIAEQYRKMREQYRKFLEQILDSHAVLIRLAEAELKRAPSADQVKKFLRLEETHTLLQKGLKINEENRS